MKKSETSRPIDLRLGARLREARRHLGWREETLATLFRVRVAQIKGYESGTKRIAATRLVEICEALRLPLAYFFGDRDITTYVTARQRAAALRTQRMIPELIRAVVRLRPGDRQDELLEAARLMLKRQGRGTPGRRRAGAR